MIVQDESGITALLDSLESLIHEAGRDSRKWKDVWSKIRSTGQAFKGSKFPSPRERQLAWNRFQSLVKSVKESQQRAREEFAARERESEYHLREIQNLASGATPSSDLDELIVAIFTGGLSIILSELIETILGPIDERKAELISCSGSLKEGWAYLTRYKGQMLRKDKDEAFQTLTHASKTLDTAWGDWKRAKNIAFERCRAEQQAAWEQRQRDRKERLARREAWEERMKENRSKLQDQLGRLEGVLKHKKRHLLELEAKRDSARSDDFRNRVKGWIDEESDRIRDIESRIDQLREWISETDAKLGY